MLTITSVLVLVLGAHTPGVTGQAASDDAAGLVGVWAGALRAGPTELRLVVKVDRGAEGHLVARMDSVDQGAKGIPASRVSLTSGAVEIEIGVIGASYSGHLSADGQQIDGTWSQGGARLPFVLKRSSAPPEISRPQVPRPPFPYVVEPVSYESTAPGVKLAGTLTRPNGSGPFPAVLLVSGSGPQDRDGAIAGHQPFLVLADYLTRRGVAVLRVDDRGVGASTGDILNATTDDFALDAQAGAAFLKERRDVAGVGLVGHSEGALVGSIVAAREQGVAFVVLLSAPGLPGDQIILRQVELIARASGAREEQITAALALQRKLLAAAKAPGEPAEAERRLAEIAAGAPREQLRAMLSPWYRHFLAYDPRPALRQLRCPVLAVTGGKDLQVPPKENLAAIAAALAEAGSSQVRLVELPGLNHLLQTAQTGLPTEYGRIEETIAPKALATIADWILKQPVAQGVKDN
jgi:uncharacterized protein